MIGVPLIAVVCWVMRHPGGTLGSDQIEATGHALDVAIALSAAYLALDRSRLHKRTNSMIASVTAIYGRDAIIGLFQKSAASLDEEKSFLILLCFAGDDEAQKLSGAEHDLKQTPFYNTINARALWAYLVMRFDRKLAFIILTLLCFWQIAATCEALHHWSPPLPAHFIWVVLLVVALGYLLPAVGWVCSEMAFDALNPKLSRWTKIIAKIRNQSVDKVEVPAAAVRKPTPRSKAASPAPRQGA